MSPPQDAVETTGLVDEEGVLHIDLPTTLEPGVHRLRLELTALDDAAEAGAQEQPNGAAYSVLSLPPLNFGAWPAGLSLRREDIYSDDF